VRAPRLAGAPISWGVCEVPGWGHQMPASRVLGEMQSLGLRATELGPDSFLPADVADRAELLGSHGLEAIGGFVPVVLHDPATDPCGALFPRLQGMARQGATTVVVAAESGHSGYDERQELDGGEWKTLAHNLDRIADTAAGLGLQAVLHPHVGTAVERREDVLRVLESSVIPLCLDTGHLLIGGTSPEWLAEQVADRVGHVHLKDVDHSWARRVQRGETTYTEAVRRGMYRPLGCGDVDITGVVKSLETSGYEGWYVLEQDTVLDREPDPGEGPVAHVRASLAFLEAAHV
jgi:inosose dehydratase